MESSASRYVMHRQKQLKYELLYLLMAAWILIAAMGFVVENMQMLRPMIVCAAAGSPTQACVGLIR